MVKQLSSKGQGFSTMSSRTADDHEHQHPLTDREEQEPKIKRQVRRRLHTTSRPFQERLLNMAEARREIVTALRIHRATVGQSRDQHEQEQEQQQRWLQLRQRQQQQVQLPPSISLKSLNCDAFFTNRLPDSHLAHFSSSYSSSTLPYPTTVALITPPPPIGGLDHLACSLPAQPLGLNLNFQGFTGSLYDAKNSDDSFDRSLIQLSPSSSYSACPSPLAAMFSGLGGQPAADTLEDASSSAALPHPALEGEEEMAAIYSIGERRSAELSELVHVDEPARRSEIADDQGMEGGGGKLRAPARQDVAVGMPTGWPGSGEPDVALEMHLDGEYYYCHQKDGDGEDITLPCMEIGEIDGWNGEWFS